jgi:5-methylcytosine-specific restriction endonuclease McrA
MLLKTLDVERIRNNRCLKKRNRYEVLERDGYACVKCGNTEKLTVHHKIERKHGGGNAHSNLVTLCRKCHIREHNK